MRVGGQRRNAGDVRHYYDRTESRLGYTFLLRGTKHYGWYEPGQSKWEFARALARMEDELAARLALPEGAEVLDAGCGTGVVARALANRHGLVVTGIDLLDLEHPGSRRQSCACRAGRRHVVRSR